MEIEVKQIKEAKDGNVRPLGYGASAELMASIKAVGLLEPLVVKQVDDGYELIAGYRRIDAIRKLGWSNVTVNVVHPDSKLTQLQMSIDENLQRKDMTPYELGVQFCKLIEEHGLSEKELASRFSMSKKRVNEILQCAKRFGLSRMKRLSFKTSKKATPRKVNTILSAARRVRLNINDTELLIKRLENKGFSDGQLRNVCELVSSGIHPEAALALSDSVHVTTASVAVLNKALTKIKADHKKIGKFVQQAVNEAVRKQYGSRYVFNS